MTVPSIVVRSVFLAHWNRVLGTLCSTPPVGLLTVLLPIGLSLE